MSDPGSRSVSRNNSISSRLVQWLFFKGDRLRITAGLTVVIFLLTWGLILGDVLAVGPRSSVKTVFGSGIVAGVITILTLTLSINQLISTRIFGAPNTLSSKFEGGEDLRKTVEDITDREVSPVSTAEFISLIGRGLQEHVEKFGESTASHGTQSIEEMTEYVSGIERYATQMHSITGSTHPISVISATAGSDYARYVRETERLQRTWASQLSDEANEHLDAIRTLLKAFSISRQYHKSMAIQQELAQLSRLLILISIPSVLTAIYVPLIYQSGPATLIAPQYLPLVISGAMAVISVPLILVIVFLMRISTIMRYTVSVGPFVALSEWPYNE